MKDSRYDGVSTSNKYSDFYTYSCPKLELDREFQIVSVEDTCTYPIHFFFFFKNLSIPSNKNELSNWMGERRGLNPRVMDPQSIALIHLATSAPSTTWLPEREREQDLSIKLLGSFD